MTHPSARLFAAFALVAGAAVAASAAEGDPYVWPAYTPSLNYNFKERMGEFPMPTKDLDDCQGVVGTQSSGWWTFKWGKNKRSVVTEKAITPMLARLNKDFAYFRDSMGWAPDLRVQKGYRSAVYLYGSGLCTDGEDSTALGGWQSGIGQYPIILASYYPIYSFDPSCTYGDKTTQQGGMVHEGIHALLASLPGAKQSAWFQEGGNTWLQQQADAQRYGDYTSMGFLNAAPLIAPFMPIECYSGWLQDGSFGGPSAEGVNAYGSDGKQICTWRNLLGGTQYGNMFPTFLGEWVGLGTIPWVWNYCKGRVLQGMSDTLGDAQTRRLIVEYRARMALLDLKKWSNAAKQLLDDNFGSSIKEEWSPYQTKVDPWTATPYAKTTDSSGYLVPEARTTPGWSGANIVPLTVSGNTVSVSLVPIGQNMSLQLCYRATDGTPVYGAPVTSGKATLRLDKAPTNNVVLAVVSNTDYKYLGDATRKAHYDYRLKPEVGVTGAAAINKKWYAVKLDYVPSTGVARPTAPIRTGSALGLRLSGASGTLRVDYSLPSGSPVSIDLHTAWGAYVASIAEGVRSMGSHTETVDLSRFGARPGTYVVRVRAGDLREAGSVTVVR